MTSSIINLEQALLKGSAIISVAAKPSWRGWLKEQELHAREMARFDKDLPIPSGKIRNLVLR